MQLTLAIKVYSDIVFMIVNLRTFYIIHGQHQRFWPDGDVFDPQAPTKVFAVSYKLS